MAEQKISKNWCVLLRHTSCFDLSFCSVSNVVEEDETKMPDENGNDVVVPINMAGPNPNEVEFDNLYLDMNGIVRLYLPCLPLTLLIVFRFIPAHIQRAKSVSFHRLTWCSLFLYSHIARTGDGR